MKTRHRLLVVMTAAALVAAVLVAAGAVGLLRLAVRERFIERIHAETALIGEWIAETEQAPDTQDLAARAGRRLGLRVTLIDRDGIVRGDSAKDTAGVASMDNHIDRPEIRAARLGGTGESLRTSDTTQIQYFYSARMLDGDGPVNYIRIALPSSEVDRIQGRYVRLLLGVVLGALLLFTAIAYLAVRRLSRPVEEMAGAVERSVAGEFDLELPRTGQEEVDHLGRAVTQLERKLVEERDELDKERGVLHSVISGMREALLMVGADRRILLVNDALRKTLDITFEPEGRLFEEVIRHPLVIQDVETALAEGRTTQQPVLRLPGSDRSFQLQVTPLLGQDGAAVEAAIVLLFDITRLERLEGIRRDFVANVSHELRTPLSSIKAFVETLLEGAIDDEANARRFLEIIRKHSDHMSALIEDLTDLSLIETGAISLDIQPIDAREVMAEVIERLEPLAAEQEVRIELDLPSPFPVHADRRRLEEIATNLLDNAIKFNKTGGDIRIRDKTAGGGPVVTVEDTGIGIPAASLDKVFHRFHQVGKDRSNGIPGTGLGLAIVKHLMRLHGGRVAVESELGQGSKFILEFPSEPRE